jgi:hypothetical protein
MGSPFPRISASRCAPNAPLNAQRESKRVATSPFHVERAQRRVVLWRRRSFGCHTHAKPQQLPPTLSIFGKHNGGDYLVRTRQSIQFSARRNLPEAGAGPFKLPETARLLRRAKAKHTTGAAWPLLSLGDFTKNDLRKKRSNNASRIKMSIGRQAKLIFGIGLFLGCLVGPGGHPWTRGDGGAATTSVPGRASSALLACRKPERR